VANIRVTSLFLQNYKLILEKMEDKCHESCYHFDLHYFYISRAS